MRLPYIPIGIVRSLLNLAAERRRASEASTAGARLWRAYLETPAEQLASFEIGALRTHWLSQSLLTNVCDLSLSCPAYGPVEHLFRAFFSDRKGRSVHGGTTTQDAFDQRISSVFVGHDTTGRPRTECLNIVANFGANLAQVAEALGPLERHNVLHNEDKTVFTFHPTPAVGYPKIRFVLWGDWQPQSDGTTYKHRLRHSSKTRVVPVEGVVPEEIEIRFLRRN